MEIHAVLYKSTLFESEAPLCVCVGGGDIRINKYLTYVSPKIVSFRLTTRFKVHLILIIITNLFYTCLPTKGSKR